MALPTIIVMLIYFHRSHSVSRWQYLFVAENAARKLRERHRILIRRVSVFARYNVANLLLTAVALCFCICLGLRPIPWVFVLYMCIYLFGVVTFAVFLVSDLFLTTYNAVSIYFALCVSVNIVAFILKSLGHLG